MLSHKNILMANIFFSIVCLKKFSHTDLKVFKEIPVVLQHNRQLINLTPPQLEHQMYGWPTRQMMMMSIIQFQNVNIRLHWVEILNILNDSKRSTELKLNYQHRLSWATVNCRNMVVCNVGSLKTNILLFYMWLTFAKKYVPIWVSCLLSMPLELGFSSAGWLYPSFGSGNDVGSFVCLSSIMII